MATKKIAKKSTAPKTAEPAPLPAVVPTAKKAAKPAKKAAAKKVAPKVSEKPSPDMIARAAYLNYRRRVEQGLPGDSHGDWLEAERHCSANHES